MKLGILVEVEEGLDWDAWRATFTEAERLGFESVWLSDHLDSPWHTRRGLETWTALAVAAAETRRITLGPLVSPVTFREPAIVARMAASLHELSHGRFVVGLGLGWNAEEHATAGITFEHAEERARRLAHTIERVRCESRVRVLVGGAGSRTLEVAARYADEWNITTASPAAFTEANARLDRLCAQIGRSPKAVERSVACGVLVGRDAEDLRARAEQMRQSVPPLSAVEDVPTAARSMGWLVGTTEEVVAHLQALKAVGVQRAVLGHYNVADAKVLELLAHSVLPAVA
jgi:alkanesulfonate monooxygenase SsuD/methylene tetrahydromethanopterin reductase-like flavin-dependent oxidoreductase (luciferase family)